MRGVLVCLLLLGWLGGAALAQGPSSGPPAHEHEHVQEPGQDAGPGAAHTIEEGHLPIQVYYHKAFFEAPWAVEGEDRRVLVQALWVLAANGVVLVLLWRFRWRR